MSQLNFQLDFLDDLVKKLRDMAGQHEAMSRNLHGRAGSAQSVGADGWVVDQVRYAGSILNEHPDQLQALSRELKGRLDIAHSVADEWQGAQSGLRVALTVAMTATGGLLGAAAAVLKGNKTGQVADKKTAKTGAVTAGAAKGLVSELAKSAVVTGSYGEGQPTVARLGKQDIVYNAPGFVKDPNASTHPGQCVEFVRRYFRDYPGVNDGWDLGKTGSAVNMYAGNPAGTTHYPNDTSTVAPRVGDALVFGPTGANTDGHVAVVMRVDGDSVTFAQQNIGWVDGQGTAHYVVTDTVPLSRIAVGEVTRYQVGTPGSPIVHGVGGSVKYGAVVGWVHADSNNATRPLDVTLVR